jgi:hypothetical protein
MKWLFAVLLALALAGCAESGNFDREKPIKLAVPIEPILPPTKPVPRKSQLARAEASKTEANDSTSSSSVMECASEACKLQCSSGVKQRNPDQNGACTLRSQSTNTHLRYKAKAPNRLCDLVVKGRQCPLSGVKRTFRFDAGMSAITL